MNFINFVRSACNEYKAIHWCFTRPFSPPQVVKGRARETIAMVMLVTCTTVADPGFGKGGFMRMCTVATTCSPF